MREKELENLKPHILIVDDEPSNTLLLKRILGKLDCEIVIAKDGWSAIDHAKQRVFALILLDILMPEINGYETLVRIKSSTKNKETPVFFMTGMETDQELLIKAYKAGAVDFIQKPMNLNILQRKTKYFLDYFKQTEELKNARVQSENLMKSRMALIANITHELRTPLFAMLGMIDVLKKECHDENQMELIQKIGLNSENLLDTVNEFLDFSKTEMTEQGIENEYFSLPRMCKDILNIMDFQYHKSDDVELKFQFDQEIPEFVRGDKKKIRHILLNLFSNSLKFTTSGFVKLEVRNIGLKQGKPFVKFIVEDTGLGIPEDKVNSIFDEYTQVDNSAQNQTVGTGLGLSISSKLVKLLGGKLSVKSVEGKGTKFSFSIPIEPGSESDIEEIKESYSLDELLGEQEVRILIADDVPDNLFVLKNYLNTPKIHLDLTHDSNEAIEKLITNEYDIALLDISMPDKDGFEVASEYEKYTKFAEVKNKTILVALTAFSMNPDFESKLKASIFSDYIMKPVKKEQLYKKIVSVAHNVTGSGFTKIAAFKDESEERDFDFDLLDNDFKEYLPTYLNNKLKEIVELKNSVQDNDVNTASAICHKILGTARSFGLFKIDREVEKAQNLIKENFERNHKEISLLIDSSMDHLEVLKEMFPD